MKWLVTSPEDNDSTPVYMDWLSEAGVAGEVATLAKGHSATHYDGLLLAGGPDIAPGRYGDRAIHEKTYGVDPARDELELTLFHEFASAGKPVFGICRGIQVMNVALGGGLIQHVPDTLAGEPVESHRGEVRYSARHSLAPDPRTVLGSALAGISEVNSSHHQAVDPARIGCGFRISAHSGRGIIEAAELEGSLGLVCAVQWHPERLSRQDCASRMLIRHVRTMAGT
jgi:putative glutamine amidotransferase